MKRFIVSLALLILVLSLMTGCKEPTPRPLEGIWTIDSTEGTPGSLELGDGQIELSFFMEFVFEMYQGDGTVGTQDYTATAMYTPDFLGTDAPCPGHGAHRDCSQRFEGMPVVTTGTMPERYSLPGQSQGNCGSPFTTHGCPGFQPAYAPPQD